MSDTRPTDPMLAEALEAFQASIRDLRDHIAGITGMDAEDMDALDELARGAAYILIPTGTIVDEAVTGTCSICKTGDCRHVKALRAYIKRDRQGSAG